MAGKYRVITMGSGLVDAFLNTGVRERKGEIFFPAGEKVLVKNIVFSVGGGGTNTASCFSKLGLKAGYLGKVGKGNNANIILRELKKKGVDFLGIQAKEHTGYSIILESNKKHRTILTFKGASNNLKFSEIKLNKLNTDWFYFTSMGGESFKSQKKIVKFAKKKNIKIAFNPSSYLTKHGVGPIREILRSSDVLCLNKEEAKMLVKNGNLFKGLYKLGAKIVCITNGDKPGGVYDGEFLYRYFPRDIYVSECTGAGDVFGSSFITGLIKSKNIEKAIRVAMANAESVITKRGAQNGMLTWNSVIKEVNRKRFKVTKEKL